MIKSVNFALRDLAWAARSFGQAKSLALAARARGDVAAARFFAREARGDWQKLRVALKEGGAL